MIVGLQLFNAPGRLLPLILDSTHLYNRLTDLILERIDHALCDAFLTLGMRPRLLIELLVLLFLVLQDRELLEDRGS